MPPHPVPPLPTAPALTLAAADQWRAARVWRRLESRWLALLPAVTVALAMAADRTPERCDGWQPCTVPYPESAAPALLLVEFLVLWLRPRGSAAVPAATGLLLWLLPNALPGPWLPAVACAAHLAVAAALCRVAVGRRRARAQLAALMGPPAPYPWTLLGAESPFEPPLAPRGRQVLAVLLGAGALALLAAGVLRTEADTRRAAGADLVRATVRSVHPHGDGATVVYRMPHELQDLTAEVGGERRVGDQVPLLVDGTGWSRAADEWQDPAPWWLGAGAAGACAALLALSARRTARERRPAGDAAPALRIRVRTDEHGDQVVLPVDGGEREAGLWRLRSVDGDAWFAPAADGEPAAWLPWSARGEDDDEDEVEADDAEDAADGEDGGAPETLAEAAARAERAAAPVDALLYQAPDGDRRPLLVCRSPEAPHAWTAQPVAAHTLPPRLRRPRSGRRPLPEEVLVKAAAARDLEHDRAEQPEGRPEPARVFGLPAAVRCAAAPVAAVLMGAVMHYAADDDGVVDGLVRPLLIGGVALIGMVNAFTWQLAVDRDGVAFSGVLRVRRAPWRQITTASVRRGRFALRGGEAWESGFAALPARLLHRHFGGPYDPQQAARTVTVLAHRPERRPLTALPADAVGSALPVNRLAIAGYLLWAVGRYLLG